MIQYVTNKYIVTEHNSISVKQKCYIVFSKYRENYGYAWYAFVSENIKHIYIFLLLISWCNV